ncbi:hypothetical protein PAV_12c00430 [Paenibacillus alvei DSM 29]|nr:hypothetical protein PAV_12c00430 [Paenibacillus alvei DSM 29]
MFKKIYGFTVLNLKILLSEKVVFLWAVALPVVVTLFFKKVPRTVYLFMIARFGT